MYAFLAAVMIAAQSATSPSTEQEQPAPVAATSVLTAAPCCTLAKLTPLALTIKEPLDSDKARIGQSFALRLAEPVTLAEGFTIPAGVEGVGEVIHAAKSRAMGKPGELVLAARYLDWNGTRIPLRSFRFGKQRGQDNVTKAAVVGAVVSVWISTFITGGEVRVPAGADAWAKVAADIHFNQPAAAGSLVSAPVAAAPVNSSQGGEK
jgi:hypothetical protein